MAKFATRIDAAAAVTQLAGQGLSGALNIRSFWAQVKRAPERFNDILEWIYLLTEIVESTEKAELTKPK